MDSISKSFLILFLILITTFCNSQPSFIWQRVYNGPGDMNDGAADICLSSDGYFYAVGAGTPIPVGFGLYVLKLNLYNGDTLWTKIIPGMNASAVTASTDGGCVVTGGAFTIKFSSSGGIVWQREYSSGTIDCWDIMRSTDGNYIACGVDRTQTLLYKGYILKVDWSGNLIWQRTYSGSSDRSFYAIEEDNGGGYILAGGVYDSLSDTVRAYLVKTDTSGSILWEKSFTINNRFSTVLQAISKSNNNYVVGGGGDNSFFVRTDSIGNILFTKEFTEYYQYPGSWFLDMKVAESNRFIFTLFATNTSGDSTCYVVVTDSVGNTARMKFFLYGRFAEFWAALPLANGDIVFAGDARPPVGQWTDVYLARTDSLLNAPPIGIRPIGNEIPDEFALGQNYPNPFNSATIINYQLPMSNYIRLVIYDVLGREIETFVNEELKAGTHQVRWNGINYPSGVYFLTLYASSKVFVRKMILIK